MSSPLSVETVAGLAADSASVGEFRTQILDSLVQQVGCQAALFHDEGPDALIDPGEAQSSLLVRLRDDWLRYGQQMSSFFLQLAQAGVASDVGSVGAFEHTDFYQELMRPQGMFETLYVRLSLGPKVRPAIIALGRGRHDKPFSQEAVSELRRLVPSLALANAAVCALTPRQDVPRLTPRERSLVDLVCRGLTNKEIATVTGLSVNTVRNRLALVFQRHGINSRAELAHRFGT